MKFRHSFLRRHLAGKPVVASPNVGCFLRLAQLNTRVTQFKRTTKPSSTLGVPLLVRWPEQRYSWLVELNLTFKSGRLQKRTARWTLKSRLNQGLHCWWRHFVQAVMLRLHPEPLWTRLAMALGIGGHLLNQKAPKFIFSFETTPEKSAYNWPWNRHFWYVILNLPISIGNSMICSDISKLLYVISRVVRRVKFETILKYHEWYLCQLSRTNHGIICLYYYPQKVCNFHM